MPNETNVNIGNAGEYFVAGELERRGFTVAVPMSNVKDFDILAIDRETHKQIAIQVKTTGYKQKKWTLSKKNENLIGDDIFYIFVSLNELDTPEYHIVPSKIVANTIKESHNKWLETPGKKGQKHNNTNIRVFLDNEDLFFDKWDLLSYQSVDDRLVPSNIYDSLISFIPRLKDIEYAKLYPEQQTGDGSIEHPFQMPFYIYADVVREFEKEVYKFEKDHPEFQTSVYKGYKQDKIEMRGDRAEMSDFPLYLNTVAGGLDRRDQTIGGFSFVVKIYAVPVVEIIG